MKAWTVLPLLGLSLTLACGGGGSSDSASASDPWAPVTAAIQADQGNFPNGVCVEVMTPSGVVYSQSFGGMTNSTLVTVASGSKWIASTTILRLVDQGPTGPFPHGLDTKTSELLIDAHTGNPWTGNMGNITLRDLLSFTSGIQGDDPNADVQNMTFTLGQAVQAIYDDDSATASAPGAYFDYGNAHLRIAAHMAEVATGKSWHQIFTEQVHDPMGWASGSTFDTLNPTVPNPDPAGDLSCTGVDYMRFVAMELRGGVDNGATFLQPGTWTAQRTDGYGPTTTISGSPYKTWFNWTIHYGLGNWIGTADGNPESTTNPAIWYGSTGSFGWCPWVTADGVYGAIIETRQSDQGKGVLSEGLKSQLDPLIRAALAQNPPVIRTVP